MTRVAEDDDRLERGGGGVGGGYGEPRGSGRGSCFLLDI